jgi:hypothetical protein
VLAYLRRSDSVNAGFAPCTSHQFLLSPNHLLCFRRRAQLKLVLRDDNLNGKLEIAKKTRFLLPINLTRSSVASRGCLKVENKQMRLLTEAI